MKKNIHTAASLAETITALNKKADHLKLNIEANFVSLKDNLRPANLIKAGASAAYKSRDKLIHAGVGLLAGFLSRRLIVGKRASVFAKTTGKLLQWGITVLISKNADKVRKKTREIIDHRRARKLPAFP